MTIKNSTTPAKKSGYKKQTQNEFEGRAMSAMPRWALAFCAILMALSLSIRQMGLDISSPLNRVMTAHAVSIEKTAGNPGISQDELEDLVELVEEFEGRIIKLEKWSHKPNGASVIN
jgi:hypothetical protein